MASNFSVESPAVPIGTSVVGFRAREALSEPFSIEVGLRTHGARLDLDGAIGAPLRLEVLRSGVMEGGLPSEPRVYNGVVDVAELLHEEGDTAYWRVTVVPLLLRLGHTLHSRVFTEVTVPAIVAAVLEDEGLSSKDFRFQLRGTYPTLEHVCMFRETSLAFVSRLLEREGITYYFEHVGDDHVMVLVDDLGAHVESRAAVPMIPYAQDDGASNEGFFEFSYEHRALPAEVRVTDYDYLRPSASIVAQSALQRRRFGVVVEHAEFVALPEEERRYADLRAEEILCREQWFQGWGRVQGLRVGYTFPVKDHRLTRLDDEYLAVELESEGFELEASQGGAAAWLAGLYGLEGRRGVIVNVGAIPRSVQFRPARVTPWPRIHGVVDGVVDGMGQSAYAQVDTQGRYRVRLHFDESDLTDGQASTWIRMLQPHGGSAEGWHFPLRKGTEVQVAFLGGDPDRPAIVAAAPNAIQQSKVRTANHTQNVIHTGGDNTITMEDAEGGQFITTFSPPDASTLHLGAGGNQVHLRTDGQGHLHTGGSMDVDVHSNKIETVAGTLRETYGGFLDLEVTGAVQRTMGTLLHQTIGGPVTEHVTGTLTESVGASVTELYQSGQATTVTGGVALTYGGTLQQTVNSAPLDETISSSRLRMVASTLGHHTTGHADETFGPTVRLVQGDYTETVGGTYTIETPQLHYISVQRTWIDTALDIVDAYQSITDVIDDILGGDSTSITGVSKSTIGLDVLVHGASTSLGVLQLSVTGVDFVASAVRIRKRGILARAKGLEVVGTGIYLIL